MNIQNLTIPEDWDLVYVCDACEILNHLREPISLEVRKSMQGIYPYYGPTGILDYLDHYQVDGEYALIGEDGDHFLKHNQMPMTILVTGKFNVNNHAHILSGKDCICTTSWFYHFFRHMDITSILSRQGAGRYKLNKATLEKLPIPLPPLPEQRKIAQILSTWDEAIQLVEALIAALKERKRGLMQRLLTGEVRFPGFVKSDEVIKTRFGNIPADWRYMPISEIALSVSAKNDGGAALPVLSCTKYDGLVDSLEYFGRQIYSEDTSTYKIVERNQFAYATNHIEEGSIGYQDLYDRALISPMYTVFETTERINDSYLYKVLKTELYRHIFEVSTSASVNRRGSLRWGEFSKIHVPLPSLIEQKYIAEVIDSANAVIEHYAVLRDTLHEQKKGLMQRLLTGKVRM